MPLTLSPVLDRLLPSRRRKLPRPTNPPEPTPPPKPVYTLPARPPEPITVKDPKDQPKGPIAGAAKVVNKVTSNGIIARALAVMDIAGQAGVGLFAAALAYGAMFALIPMVLLLAGVLGWLVEDPVQREALLVKLISYFPPLAEFFSAALNGMVAARGALSLIGLVGLLWGASSFYGSLDEVMRRIFVGGRPRGEFDRRARGVIAIFGLMGLIVGTVLLSGIWATINDAVGEVAIWRYLAPIIALAVFVFAVLVVYKLVPRAAPSLRAALPPSILAGLGIGLLTNLFGLLAPLLVGGLAGLGVIATAFALLIWLNFSFQILLFGASWARLRRDMENDKRSIVEI